MTSAGRARRRRGASEPGPRRRYCGAPLNVRSGRLKSAKSGSAKRNVLGVLGVLGVVIEELR